MHARAHVEAALARRAPELAGHLAHCQDERASDVVRVREVGEVVLPDAPRAVPAQHRAHRQQAVRGIAGDDVGAAGPVGEQQSPAVGVATLELRSVTWMVGDDRLSAVLLPPAKGRHVVVVAMQQPGLARTCLGGPVRLPTREPVGAGLHPACHSRGISIADRAKQHVVGQAVDLEEQQARRFQDVAIPEAVIVDRQRARDCRADDRDRHRRHDCRRQRRNLQADVHRRRQQNDRAVEDDRAQAQREDRQREREPQDQRPEQRVEHSDQRRRAQRRSEAVYFDAAQQSAEQHERGRR